MVDGFVSSITERMLFVANLTAPKVLFLVTAVFYYVKATGGSSAVNMKNKEKKERSLAGFNSLILVNVLRSYYGCYRILAMNMIFPHMLFLEVAVAAGTFYLGHYSFYYPGLLME